MSNYETSDEQTLVRPKRFLFVGFLILIVSILLYWGVSMYSANSVWQTQQDIFLQESVTATTEVESAKKILQSANETKQREAVVPVGITSGVRFYTDGIMVLGIGDVVMACGHRASPSQGKLEVGDIVQKVNGKVVEDISQMVNAINDANGAVLLGIIRDDTSKTIEVTPVKSGDDAMVKIGCWVRDSTQGIGTITYYNPLTKCFGALGHGIMDVDTGRLLSVSSGHLFKANIVDIRKGEKGMPGELIGEIDQNSIIADITKNTTLGLYGQINIDHIDLPRATFITASHNEISRGPAKIFSNIEGGAIKAYDVFIESINKDSNADKGLVIRITDQGLIKRTGGIVQGMSGSPITQADKIVGAITHVFVQDPLRGYGVFIERMLAQ